MAKTEDFAKATLEKLVEHTTKNPKHAVSHFHLSKKLADKGQVEKSLVHSLLAVENGVPRAGHYTNVAKMLINMKMPHLAELCLHDALHKGVRTPQIYFRLAQSFAKQHQWSSAAEAVEYAISLAPQQPAYQRYKTRIAARLGKK